MADVLFSPLKLAKKSVKKTLVSIMTLLLMSLSIQPQGVLAAEIVENANISDNSAETVQDVLKGICEDHGYGEICAKHLLGILMQESMGDGNALGDHGYAHGWFQINRYYNPKVTVACAVDLRCSAEWTIKHLEAKGYPNRVSSAILCHNGCGISKTYVRNVLRKSELYWDEPIMTTVELARN